jgi:PAS domain S-box-containing protein
MTTRIRDANEKLANIVTSLMAAVSVIAMIGLVFANAEGSDAARLSRIAVAIATIAAGVFAMFEARRGQLRRGVAIAMVAIFCAISAHAVLAGLGIHAYLLSAGALQIFACYVLIGERAGHVATAVGVSTLCVLLGLEAHGIAFGGKEWVISSRNVFVVHGLLYLVSAVMAWGYQRYFATLLAELEREQGQFRELFHAMPAGCMMSKDAIVLECNERYAEHCGYDHPRKLIGKRLVDLVQPQMLDLMKDRLLRTLDVKPGQSLPVTPFRLRDRNGNERIIEVRTHRVTMAAGEFFLTITLDVTEREAAIEELARQREHANAANRAKSSFLAVMSHEIRTPLNAIVGLTEVMCTDTLSEELRTRYLSMVADSSQTLLGLLNDVLDLSKIEAGKLELQVEPVNIEQLLGRIGNGYAALAAAKNVGFKVDIEPGVPKVIEIDPLRTRQVLGNLISNALKFTATGGIRVRIFQNERSKQLCIEVRDTGIGLRPEAAARLFGAFEQAATSAREFGGSGLGLSLSRELVELMGGSIEVSSEAGVGATFLVRLPLIVPDRQSPEALVAAADTLPAARQFPGCRVLVVEDNEVNGMVIQAMLSLRGIDVGLYVDAESALAASHNVRFDLALVDLQLPDIDGFECAKRLRAVATPDSGPILAYTASPIAGGDPRSVDAGFADILHKPVTQAALSVTLEKWLIPRSFSRETA